MPIIELLAIKGLTVIAKTLAAKGLLAKAGLIAAKAISTYGLSATVGTTLLVGVVVGGIYWTKERVDYLAKGLRAIEDNDIKTAAWNFGKLAISSGTDIEILPDAVHDYLVKIHVSEEKAKAAADAISDLEYKIADEIRRMG